MAAAGWTENINFTGNAGHSKCLDRVGPDGRRGGDKGGVGAESGVAGDENRNFPDV